MQPHPQWQREQFSSGARRPETPRRLVRREAAESWANGGSGLHASSEALAVRTTTKALPPAHTNATRSARCEPRGRPGSRSSDDVELESVLGCTAGSSCGLPARHEITSDSGAAPDDSVLECTSILYGEPYRRTTDAELRFSAASRVVLHVATALTLATLALTTAALLPSAVWFRAEHQWTAGARPVQTEVRTWSSADATMVVRCADGAPQSRSLADDGASGRALLGIRALLFTNAASALLLMLLLQWCAWRGRRRHVQEWRLVLALQIPAVLGVVASAAVIAAAYVAFASGSEAGLAAVYCRCIAPPGEVFALRCSAGVGGAAVLIIGAAAFGLLVSLLVAGFLVVVRRRSEDVVTLHRRFEGSPPPAQPCIYPSICHSRHGDGGVTLGGAVSPSFARYPCASRPPTTRPSPIALRASAERRRIDDSSEAPHFVIDDYVPSESGVAECRGQQGPALTAKREVAAHDTSTTNSSSGSRGGSSSTQGRSLLDRPINGAARAEPISRFESSRLVGSPATLLSTSQPETRPVPQSLPLPAVAPAADGSGSASASPARPDPPLELDGAPIAEDGGDEELCAVSAASHPPEFVRDATGGALIAVSDWIDVAESSDAQGHRALFYSRRLQLYFDPESNLLLADESAEAAEGFA